MKTETAEVRPTEWGEKIQAPAGKRSGAGVTVFVALLLLTLLAYGAWAQTPADGTTAPGTYGTEQPAEGGHLPQDANSPADRPHPRGLPRGLPRRNARQRVRRDRGCSPAAGNAPSNAPSNAPRETE